MIFPQKPFHEISRLGADEPEAFFELSPARRKILAADGLQVIHVVEINVVEFFNGRLDVSWNGDIDQKKRFFVPETHPGAHLVFVNKNERRKR
jgi:hypothetical protein